MLETACMKDEPLPVPRAGALGPEQPLVGGPPPAPTSGASGGSILGGGSSMSGAGGLAPRVISEAQEE